MKEKYIRRNEGPLMNNSVRKAIMVWTQLLNKFRKENSLSMNQRIKGNGIFVLHLLRRQKGTTFIITLT